MERLALYATASRGTEDLLAQELEELGAVRVKRDRGGVRFAANLLEGLRICMWSRIAMRVLYPLGEFEARGAEGIYDAAASVPWEDHLSRSSTFAVDATLKSDEHTHSGFIALKIKDAIVDRLRGKLGARPDVDTRDPAVRVVARLSGSRLTLSLDLCGEPLYKRGYRRGSFKAPLNECLAAAILRAAGYRGDEPLWDPLCGSGTFLVEAAWIALRRPPNLRRRFGVEAWPALGSKARSHLVDLREEALAEERAPTAPIFGSDKSEEAIAAAKLNASAAKLGRAVTLKVSDATDPTVPSWLTTGGGLLVSNPPYGERLAGGTGTKGMKSFYFKLGEGLAHARGWRRFFLAGHPAFESAFHARPSSRRQLWNGPIECTLLGYPAAP